MEEKFVLEIYSEKSNSRKFVSKCISCTIVFEKVFQNVFHAFWKFYSRYFISKILSYSGKCVEECIL